MTGAIITHQCWIGVRSISVVKVVIQNGSNALAITDDYSRDISDSIEPGIREVHFKSFVQFGNQIARHADGKRRRCGTGQDCQQLVECVRKINTAAQCRYCASGRYYCKWFARYKVSGYDKRKVGRSALTFVD